MKQLVSYKKRRNPHQKNRIMNFDVIIKLTFIDHVLQFSTGGQYEYVHASQHM